jgi:hypothetical protein
VAVAEASTQSESQPAPLETREKGIQVVVEAAARAVAAPADLMPVNQLNRDVKHFLPAVVTEIAEAADTSCAKAAAPEHPADVHVTRADNSTAESASEGGKMLPAASTNVREAEARQPCETPHGQTMTVERPLADVIPAAQPTACGETALAPMDATSLKAAGPLRSASDAFVAAQMGPLTAAAGSCTGVEGATRQGGSNAMSSTASSAASVTASVTASVAASVAVSVAVSPAASVTPSHRPLNPAARPFVAQSQRDSASGYCDSQRQPIKAEAARATIAPPACQLSPHIGIRGSSRPRAAQATGASPAARSAHVSVGENDGSARVSGLPGAPVAADSPCVTSPQALNPRALPFDPGPYPAKARNSADARCAEALNSKPGELSEAGIQAASAARAVARRGGVGRMLESLDMASPSTAEAVSRVHELADWIEARKDSLSSSRESALRVRELASWITKRESAFFLKAGQSHVAEPCTCDGLDETSSSILPGKPDAPQPIAGVEACTAAADELRVECGATPRSQAVTIRAHEDFSAPAAPAGVLAADEAGVSSGPAIGDELSDGGSNYEAAGMPTPRTATTNTTRSKVKPKDRRRGGRGRGGRKPLELLSQPPPRPAPPPSPELPALAGPDLDPAFLRLEAGEPPAKSADIACVEGQSDAADQGGSFASCEQASPTHAAAVINAALVAAALLPEAPR